MRPSYARADSSKEEGRELEIEITRRVTFALRRDSIRPFSRYTARSRADLAVMSKYR